MRVVSTSIACVLSAAVTWAQPVIIVRSGRPSKPNCVKLWACQSTAMRKTLFILLAIVAVAVLAVLGLARRWTPARRTQIKLYFLRPFEGHNTAVFTLAPQGAATTVT